MWYLENTPLFNNKSTAFKLETSNMCLLHRTVLCNKTSFIDNVSLGGGSPPVPFFRPNLPGPQNTRKWTIHTWNVDVRPPTFIFFSIFSREIQFSWLFLGWISDFSHQQKEFDRNGKCSECSEMDSHINLIFSDDKCPLFTRLGGGFAQRGQCHLFYWFSYIRASPSYTWPSYMYLMQRGYFYLPKGVSDLFQLFKPFFVSLWFPLLRMQRPSTVLVR